MIVHRIRKFRPRCCLQAVGLGRDVPIIWAVKNNHADVLRLLLDNQAALPELQKVFDAISIAIALVN